METRIFFINDKRKVVVKWKQGG